MTVQSHTWFWRFWRNIARWFARGPSHPHLTVPALYSVPSGVLEPIARTVSVTQWQLNDSSSTAADHNTGRVRVEVELISEPLPKREDPTRRITHYPSERLH